MSGIEAVRLSEEEVATVTKALALAKQQIIQQAEDIQFLENRCIAYTVGTRCVDCERQARCRALSMTLEIMRDSGFTGN